MKPTKSKTPARVQTPPGPIDIPPTIRPLVQTFVYSELLAFPEYYNKLSGKERIDVLLRMLPFALPSRKTHEIRTVRRSRGTKE